MCPQGNVVGIEFEEKFAIAGEMPKCEGDKVSIFDCEEEFGPFCHVNAPEPIVTNCNEAAVKFESKKTKRSNANIGFRMTYKCTVPQFVTKKSTTLPSTQPPDCNNGQGRGSGKEETLETCAQNGARQEHCSLVSIITVLLIYLYNV